VHRKKNQLHENVGKSEKIELTMSVYFSTIHYQLGGYRVQILLARDSKYVSPFHAKRGARKRYMTFEPDGGGERTLPLHL